MIRVRDLRACYGLVEVLHGVSVQLSAGEVVGVLGANGAGKSTLLRAISGQVKITGGSVQIHGRDVARLRPHERARLGVAHVPEGRRLFGSLGVVQNLRLGAYGGGRAARSEAEGSLRQVFDLFPVLRERQEQVAGTLSGGESQMLAIGRALMSRPSVLLLDEPSMGLAPMVVDNIFDVLGRLRTETGLGVLLVEQNAAATLDVADRCYVLELGQVHLEGASNDLRDNGSIAHIYLGGQAAQAGRPATHESNKGVSND